MLKKSQSEGVLAIMKCLKKRRISRLFPVLAILLIVITTCGIYVSDYYHADTIAIEKFSASTNVRKTTLADGVIAYSSGNAETGLIFYPGGKVEYTAYEPLMLACAEQGILCVLLKMPFNLAVLDVNAADGIQDHFPEIEEWYIGGHSLGGSMAANYLAKNANNFKGLILIASYSTTDLSEDDLKALSIYGSEDNVLNHEKYKEYKTNLPGDFEEIVLDGACHAYFGMYGEQDGDGTPTIENEEQIQITAEKISAWL